MNSTTIADRSMVTSADMVRFISEQHFPSVSIYLPTPQAFPERQSGRIRYGNLLDQAEESLSANHIDPEVRAMLDQFRSLSNDGVFWEHPQPGLAVLGSPITFHTFDLRQPPPEQVFAGESFYVLPLVRMLQSAERFHVLCLQRERIQLFEGTRDGLDPLELEGIPLTVSEAFSNDVAVRLANPSTLGKPHGEPRLAPRGPDALPGQPAKGDDAKQNEENFFRVVDRAVWEHVSRPTGLPLYLVALREQQAVFRSLSVNPQVRPVGVEQGPANRSERELREAVWSIVEQEYLARLQKVVDDFHIGKMRGMAFSDIRAAAEAARESRVGVLLVEADRCIPGRIDPVTATVRPEPDDFLGGDLLNDLALLVLQKQGEVIVVPAERMPTQTGLAAVLRF